MAWQWEHREQLVGFDLETTGTDIERDRVVTAALVALPWRGDVSERRAWLLDPGVPIPAQATAIHGVPTRRARARGTPAPSGIAEITGAVAGVLSAGTPLAVMNARYDLSLLDRECRRHGVRTLSERLGTVPCPVLDPLVLDKHVDRERKGSRTLQALCAHYGISLRAAHTAEADAAAAARTARCIVRAYPSLAVLPPAELHALQVRAAAEQGAARQSRMRQGVRARACPVPGWPLIPYEPVP